MHMKTFHPNRPVVVVLAPPWQPLLPTSLVGDVRQQIGQHLESFVIWSSSPLNKPCCPCSVVPFCLHCWGWSQCSWRWTVPFLFFILVDFQTLGNKYLAWHDFCLFNALCDSQCVFSLCQSSSQCLYALFFWFGNHLHLEEDHLSWIYRRSSNILINGTLSTVDQKILMSLSHFPPPSIFCHYSS